MKPIVIAILLCSLSFAQNTKPASKLPHVMGELTLDLNGNGSSVFGASARPAVNFENKYFSSMSSYTYTLTKKSDDDTVNNRKGREIHAEEALFLKLHKGWLIGGGAGFAKLSTTNYDKYHNLWKAGFGRDYYWNTGNSMRVSLAYLQEWNEKTSYPTLQTFTSPGGTGSYQAYSCQCGNGGKGIDINIWYPNPGSNHHFFFHGQSTFLIFHTSVVDPYNVKLTKLDKSQHSIGDWLSFGFVARF